MARFRYDSRPRCWQRRAFRQHPRRPHNRLPGPPTSGPRVFPTPPQQWAHAKAASPEESSQVLTTFWATLQLWLRKRIRPPQNAQRLETVAVVDATLYFNRLTAQTVNDGKAITWLCTYSWYGADSASVGDYKDLADKIYKCIERRVNNIDASF
ncbi:hypothetical protein CCACVL1_17699 [Corchorus capsularis]|uniref:Uncharacterized protein n=1 Tax=Corchorus capsularis TaxID=210143 RepID=A0A1R3HQQ9_COCAP|nr:hypothetical protein CCACVL1_17699 [Corchorus capsularis]